MPFGDRTGPRGLGPMTGRGFGQCADAWRTGWFEGYCRRGGGGAWGGGRGWRRQHPATGLPGLARAGRRRHGNRPNPPGTAQDELEYLRDYITGLEQALDASKARMADLEQAGPTE